MSIGRRALIIDILHMTILLGLLFVILFIFFHNGLSSGSSYLYDGTEFAPVVDYLPPSRLIDETEADYRARQNNPEFLSTTDLSHRIVVFYSPWCPINTRRSSIVNIMFKHTFKLRVKFKQHIKFCFIPFLARYMELFALKYVHPFSVERISIDAIHHVLFLRQIQQNIRGYPTIKYFSPHSTEGIDIQHRESAQAILRDIGLDVGNNETQVITALRLDGKEIESLEYQEQKHEAPVRDYKGILRDRDLLAHKRRLFIASRASTVVEDKNILYNDAATSFRFALRYSIFSASTGRMSKQSASSLRNWLELLGKTLPGEVMRSTSDLVHLLLNDFEKVTDRNEEFERWIFTNMEDTFIWSSSCAPNNSVSGLGYTCGLWQLFHIMTIGLVEWNKITQIEGRLSTIDAAMTLRNYIEHFFMCEECKRNFLEMFDSCGFDHCHLFTGRTTESSDWEQLSLWLFEVHNDVRVRTLREGLLREGLPEPSLDEIQSVRWPPRDKCLACWRDESVALPSANKLEIFNFMHRTLWSDRVVIPVPESDTWSTFAWSGIFMLIIVTLALRSKKKLMHLKAG